MVHGRPVQSPMFLSNLLWGAFRYPTDIDSRSSTTLYLPHTSPYGACHCLTVGGEFFASSNATSSNKTLTLFSAKFAFCSLLCVWISITIQEMKIAEKNRNQRKFQCKRRPTASSRQSAVNQHRVFDVVYPKSLVTKPLSGTTTDFPERKQGCRLARRNTHHRPLFALVIPKVKVPSQYIPTLLYLVLVINNSKSAHLVWLPRDQWHWRYKIHKDSIRF